MTTTQSRTAGTPGRRATTTARRAGASVLDGRRMPSGSRRYGQWAASVAFLLLVGLAAAYLWQQKSGRVDVLEVNKNVPAGAQIERSDLSAVAVAGVPNAVPVSQLSSVLGKTLKVGLTSGQLLTDSVVTSQPVPGPGQRLVGVELAAGRAPAGLSAGDAVEVLQAPPATDTSSASTALSQPQMLASDAVVYTVHARESGTVELSLLVPTGEATVVAEYGAAGQIVVVQAPLGDTAASGSSTSSGKAKSGGGQ